MSDYLKTLAERVVIFDGGMGTCIQQCSPTLDDFWGKENCSEVLNLSRPDIIRQIHEDYFKSGADVVETNTFGGSRVVLAEFGLPDKVVEINAAAVKIAREIADAFSTQDRRRFVAGSIGPTTKLPSLGHIGWDAMLAAYVEQATVLIDAGVDLLLVETCQDLLQAKIGVVACFDAIKKTGRIVPVQVQVTLQHTGTMLLGTEIGAALTTLQMFDVAAIGLNCATGPAEMSGAVRYLSRHSPMPISVLPNAGLPESDSGAAAYALTPEELAQHHKRFIEELGVNIVGGCCGTTPAHIARVSETCANLVPAKRDVKPMPAAASMYVSVPLDRDPKPLMVAEELNAERSEHFRGLLREGKRDAILSLAKQAVNAGAHLLDLRCAREDEAVALSKVLEKIVTRVRVPILIDSSDPSALEPALKLTAGKALIGPISLLHGEERAGELLSLAKRYGAGVIIGTVSVPSTLYDMAVQEHGIRPQDVVIEVATSSIVEHRASAMESLAALKHLREILPDAKTMLAVGNLSLGISPQAQRVLNSVFLHEAVNFGLDIALVSFAQLLPMDKIVDTERRLALQLIHGDATDGDPLATFQHAFAESKEQTAPGGARG